MLDQALWLYPFVNPKVEFIRHNENITYKVTDDSGEYLLRIHRSVDGFNVGEMAPDKPRCELAEGEMELLSHLAAVGGLGTQRPISARNGAIVGMIKDGVPVSVLGWIDGVTLDKVDMSEAIAYSLGKMTGALHKAMACISTAKRYDYGARLINRMLEECSIAEEAGHFSDKQQRVVAETLRTIRDMGERYKNSFILNHADLSKGNMVYSDGRIVPIDFSLSGYALPEFDIAALCCNVDEAFHPHILEGYKASWGEPADKGRMELLICLQILLFVIFQHNKYGQEEWFSRKLDQWSEERFLPAISAYKLQ